jgi:hypothetical protein
MKIGILLFEQWHCRKDVGGSRLRGHFLFPYWKEAEPFVQGKKYDVVIFQKTYFPEFVKAYNGIKILDLCDPDWLDTVPIKEIIDNVDAVTVSSEGLRDAISQFTDKPVVFIPDRQDLNFHNVQKVHKGRAKMVVYYGYSHNAKVLDIALSTLKKFQLKLKVISDCRPPYTKADINVKYDWENPNWSFNKEVLEADFCILPEDNRPRGKFKSNNKTLTAWALGMPVAKTPQDVKRFLDPEERKKEADKNLKEVREKYDSKQSVEEFKSLIKQLQDAKR